MTIVKVESKEDLPRTISAPIVVKKVEPLEESKDILTAHIASYSTKDSAEKGITFWKEKYPSGAGTDRCLSSSFFIRCSYCLIENDYDKKTVCSDPLWRSRRSLIFRVA